MQWKLIPIFELFAMGVVLDTAYHEIGKVAELVRYDVDESIYLLFSASYIAV